MAEAAVNEAKTLVMPDQMNDAQRSQWLRTGEHPEAKPPEAKTDEAKESKGEKRETNRDEGRNWKFLRESKERAENETRKEREAREKAERERDEWKAKAEAASKPVEKKAETTTAEPKEPERPKRPKLAEFPNDMNAYEAAMDKYDEAMLKYPAQKAAFDAAKADADKQTETAKERQQRVIDSWKTIGAKGKELYGEDWTKYAFANDLPIIEHDPVERYLRDSEPEIAAHLLQYLGINRKDLERIAGLTSRQQFKELEALEEALRDELKIGGKVEAKTAPTEKEIAAAKAETEDKEEKAEAEEKPIRRVSAAPKPPAEVGGKGTPTEDPLRAAVASRNFEKFRDIANQRDIERRKRGR